MELSKIFGVERGAPFMVEGYESGVLFRVRLNESGIEHLQVDFGEGDGWEYSNGITWAIVIHLAPAGIIHLPPPLTDEQREQLRAIWTLGGRWLVMDVYKDVRYFNEIPHKSKTSWQTGNDDEDAYYGYRLYNTLDICRLVSWSDPEPYDIGKALGVGE